MRCGHGVGVQGCLVNMMIASMYDSYRLQLPCMRQTPECGARCQRQVVCIVSMHLQVEMRCQRLLYWIRMTHSTSRPRTQMRTFTIDRNHCSVPVMNSN